MPNFPSINTLSQKEILTGDEVIQISATEKTTLSKLVELALGALLPSFDKVNINIKDNLPNISDTVLKALEKIWARSGGDSYAVYPIDDYSNGVRYYGIVMFLKTNYTNPLEYVLSIYFNNSNGKLYGAYYRSVVPIESSNTTPKGLWDYLYNKGQHIILNSIESFHTIPSSWSGFRLSPGDVTTILTNISRIELDFEEWKNYNGFINIPRYNNPILGVGQSVIASLLSKVNILKSMFTVENVPNGINTHFLFSEDFDLDPGTEYQCVCIQEFADTNKNIYFVINKAGYTEN